MEELTPLDLLEHERFHGFFDVAVSAVVAEIRSGNRTNRGAYRSLKAKGIIDDEKIRKHEIYLCGQKRSSLSKRERDLLEALTTAAGARLVAWLYAPKKETPVP